MLSPAEWRRAAALAAVVVALHLGGLVLLLASGVYGVGIGITADTLVLRHAFDADPLDHDAWLASARGAIDRLLGL